MRKRSIFTIPAAAAGVITLGLLVGAAAPTPGVEAPTPTTTVIEEDDPRWDCETMGNQVCGEASDAATAWDVWDEQDGARLLKVDPSCETRVDYMASSDEYPQNTDGYDLALVGKDGRWYVFRAACTTDTI